MTLLQTPQMRRGLFTRARRGAQRGEANVERTRIVRHELDCDVSARKFSTQKTGSSASDIFPICNSIRGSSSIDSARRIMQTRRTRTAVASRPLQLAQQRSPQRARMVQRSAAARAQRRAMPTTIARVDAQRVYGGQRGPNRGGGRAGGHSDTASAGSRIGRS